MMRDRILYLDGLRGILAVIVFLHHYFYAFYPELIFGGNYEDFMQKGPLSLLRLVALTPVNLLFNPGFAIHFFFLLSGYVQTRGYFVKPEISFLQKSILKRYFRLAIPVLSVVLLVFLCHRLHVIHKELIPVNDLNSAWLKSLCPNTLTFFQAVVEGLSNCFRGNSRYYQVLWTMPTELVNSFVVLTLLLMTHTVKHQTKIFVFLILVQLVVLNEFYSVAFVFGMLFAKLETNSIRFKTIFSKRSTKIMCLLGGLYFGSYPFTGYQNSAANSVYAPISFFDTYPHVISYLIGVILLFCALLYSSTIKTVLEKKIFLFYGRISFMFYLVHFIILLSFTPWLFYKLYNNGVSAVSLLVVGVCSFLVITGISSLLTRYIDKPVINYCNTLVKKFF